MATPNIQQLVINKIATEINAIKTADPTTFGKYSVVITNEQQFIKQSDESPYKIFIVVKLLQGTRDYGQQRQPFTINALGEQNSIGVCQKLMMDLAETYNLNFETVAATTSVDGYTLRQTFSTVSAVSNFSEVFAGFRSLFYVSGTFYIGFNGNPVVKMEISSDGGTTWNEIDFINVQFSYDTQHDSQAFYSTNNFTRTVNKIATFAIGFTMYANDKTWYQNLMAVAFNSGSPDIDKVYKIRVYTKALSGSTPAYYLVDTRLTSLSSVQEIRDFPAVSLTFSR